MSSGEIFWLFFFASRVGGGGREKTNRVSPDAFFGVFAAVVREGFVPCQGGGVVFVAVKIRGVEDCVLEIWV